MANGKPGAPVGNTNNKKGKIWSDALRKELDGTKNAAALRKLARKLIKLANEGNMMAMKEIGDRLEGKAVQAIEGTGDSGEIPLSLAIRYVSTSRDE